jgi:ankyrin repeat protein
MWKHRILQLTLCMCLFAGVFSAQTTGKVDFARDVQPIFQQNCLSCHGPSQQINGLRLDRRSSVINSRRLVVPGGVENSQLLGKLLGVPALGPQMPPTGPLRPAQIDIIKRWIEQGAEWPDSLANELELPPLNPKAIELVETLRTGDRQAFLKRVADDPKLLNARGPEGSTPFMYAVLYCDAPTLERLLKQGADPNLRNDAKATALMWAATDLEKTRVLLEHGADVNARSDDLRTPLIIAATRQGNSPVVKLLLERGADPNPNPRPAEMGSPLVQAGSSADPEMMQLLIERGANVKAAAEPLLASAITIRCAKCLDLILAKNPDRDAFTGALVATAVFADVNTIRLLLDRGADVNAFDPAGRTALMYAAVSDLVQVDVVKLLIERGADVNAKDRHTLSGDAGLTVLDIAKLQGDTPVVDVLVKAGAKGSSKTTPALKAVRGNTIQAAIQRSVPLIQRADSNFTPKAGCISCHNDSLEAMATGLARRGGFRLDEEISAKQVKANISHLERFRDRLHQGVYLVQVNDDFGAVILGYILTGLDAERHKPDLNTDTVAFYLKTHQMVDGHWAIARVSERPPICLEYIGQTALAMRALQLYAPKTDKASFDKSIQLAANWIAKADAVLTEDRSWRLLGLAWAGADKAVTQKAIRELVAFQRSDGGWSDLPSLGSTAYATGRVLVALQTAGLPATDPVYQRGVQFLLNSQQEDGSWYVKTRALGFQPYFDAGFPYAHDQWISAAGTSWATMALTLASAPRAVTASAGLRFR